MPLVLNSRAAGGRGRHRHQTNLTGQAAPPSWPFRPRTKHKAVMETSGNNVLVQASVLAGAGGVAGGRAGHRSPRVPLRSSAARGLWAAVSPGQANVLLPHNLLGGVWDATFAPHILTVLSLALPASLAAPHAGPKLLQLFQAGGVALEPLPPGQPTSLAASSLLTTMTPTDSQSRRGCSVSTRRRAPRTRLATAQHGHRGRGPSRSWRVLRTFSPGAASPPPPAPSFRSGRPPPHASGFSARSHPGRVVEGPSQSSMTGPSAGLSSVLSPAPPARRQAGWETLAPIEPSSLCRAVL